MLNGENGVTIYPGGYHALAILQQFSRSEGSDCSAFDNEKTAAMGGLAQAQYNLAVMYDTGRGVKKDDDQALAWCTKAALQGYREAIEWLLRGAEREEFSSPCCVHEFCFSVWRADRDASAKIVDTKTESPSPGFR